MPNVGDRVIVEGNKVGQLRREGVLVEALGSLIKVRWADGSESLFTPGAGSVRFEAGNGTSAKKPAAKAKTAAKKPGAKAATAKKPVAKAKTAKKK